MMVTLACITGLSGCASRPEASEVPRTPSYALTQTTETSLGMALAPLLKQHPSLSGLRLVRTGQDAFTQRINLVEAAEKTLDLQYYSMHDDRTGQLLLEAVLRAADRGVRVRILIDDISLKEVNDELSVLNAHKKIEIRVFNPMTRESQSTLARLGNLITHFNDATRRMHNKALISDNQIAIVGGRNLGDEYFDAGPEFNFNDLDIITAGPVTARISHSFDDYWNNDNAFPISALHPPAANPARITDTRNRLKAHWEEVRRSEDRSILRHTNLVERIRNNQFPLTFAKAELAADEPEKIDLPPEAAPSKPAARLDQLLAKANSEFIAVTPYFVPQDDGVQWIKALVDRGIRVRIITNSLASTDVVAVHTGYSRYREDVLNTGAELYELKPVPGAPPDKKLLGSSSRASLHAKVYVIDRKEVVIGSFNLDPRSIELNTELALVVHSPEIAQEVAQMFEESISPEKSFHLLFSSPGTDQAGLNRTNAGTHLQWVTEIDGKETIFDSDPEAGFWRNVEDSLFSLWPGDGQL